MHGVPEPFSLWPIRSPFNWNKMFNLFVYKVCVGLVVVKRDMYTQPQPQRYTLDWILWERKQFFVCLCNWTVRVCEVVRRWTVLSIRPTEYFNHFDYREFGSASSLLFTIHNSTCHKMDKATCHLTLSKTNYIEIPINNNAILSHRFNVQSIKLVPGPKIWSKMDRKSTINWRTVAGSTNRNFRNLNEWWTKWKPNTCNRLANIIMDFLNSQMICRVSNSMPGI